MQLFLVAKFVLFATQNGMVKKTSLEEYSKTKKKTGLAAIDIKEGDALASVTLIDDEDVITRNYDFNLLVIINIVDIA